MTSFKRKSKRGRITIVRRSSRGGTTLGVTVGHSNIKRAIANGELKGVTNAGMAKAFDISKQGEPGLLEKWGYLPNRKNQKNPYR